MPAAQARFVRLRLKSGLESGVSSQEPRVHLAVKPVLEAVGIVAIPLIGSALRYGFHPSQPGPDDWLRDAHWRDTTRVQWVLLAVGAVAVGVLWYLMRAYESGDQVWPLYAFLGAALYFVVVWFDIMTRLWP